MSPRVDLRARAHTLAALLATLAAAAPAAAQQESTPAAGAVRTLTADDYARAERFTSWGVAPLVSLPSVRPDWLSDGRFRYRRTTPEGGELIEVDPARRTRTRVAAPTGAGAAEDENPAAPRNSVVSPDGKLAAFVRDHDLWVRDLAAGTETRLTTDGAKDFGYATNNAGWTRSERPVLVWSPDSRRIATFQHDARGVGEMYVVRTGVGHPKLEAWKYPLVGDSAIFTIHRVVVNLDGPAPRVVRLDVPPDPHRSTLCDHVVCGGEWVDVEWSPDGSQLAFVSSSRDHRSARLRVADPETGKVREVLEETVPTFFESGTGRVNWHFLPATNEVVWFSRRDDWGNLYLYDLRTGRLKNRITSGPGNVLQVLRIDPRTRTVWFTGVGRERGRDPYLRHLYRVGLDGKGLTLLTPEDADHDVALSPDGRYFVDSYSRVDVPPVTVLRDAAGKVVMELERGDVSRLAATGWTPPIPFTVKARDGKTDLYGLMYRPTNFDSTRKYPIVNRIYPGPQTGSVGSRSFSAARSDSRALAELGFIVVEIDAMGTPLRSHSFHAAYYGDMGDNGLPDQVAGMKELARRHRWIDLDRVGIWGHSGGGFAAAGALLRYPDFFKVGVAQAGNHDNRNYEDDWGEKWQGLLERRPDGTTSYDDQANQNHVRGLKGKLLLAHGTADGNVPPDNTLLVVDALIRENKDFDLLMLPNRGHGFANEPYMVRRRWDYFVRHLMGAEPPREYEMLPVRQADRAR